MRICFAADTYKPYVSGVTNYISLHKAELERRGHEVRVITFGPRSLKTNEPGIVYSPGYQLKMGYSFGFHYSLQALETLLQMDIVHLHHPFISGQLILKACKQRNIPIVFTGHTRYDRFFADYVPWFPSQAGLGLLKLYLPGFCRKMDRVISNSPASVEGLRNCGVDVPLEVIPNGIDLKPFKGASKDPGLRSQLADDNKTIFLYVGRLAVEKNLPMLMEAFSGLCQKNLAVQLVMVGTGPIANQLKEDAVKMGIGTKVTFTGSIDHAALPAYFASSDVFVMTSINDTHPLTILEATGAGLPLIVVQSPAYHDTVIDGVNGMVTPNSAKAVTAAMENLVLNANLRVDMGHSSREISEKFSVEGTTEQLLNLYRTVLDEKSKR